MSIKLQTLKKHLEDAPSIPTLLDFLDQALKEKEFDEIIFTIEKWDGPKPIDLDFFLGVAYLEMGQQVEGATKLRSVIKVNPTHFKAKQKLEEFGFQVEEKEKTEEKLKVSRAVILEETIVKENSVPKFFQSKILLFAIAFVTIAIFAFIYFKDDGKNPEIAAALASPEEYLFPLNYAEYTKKVSDLLIIDNDKKQNKDMKKMLFYLYAFAIADYHLDKGNDILYQLRYYYDFVNKKEPEVHALYSFIQSGTHQAPIVNANRIESKFPKSLEEIKSLNIDKDIEVTRKNLRERYYSALLLYRIGDFRSSLEILENIRSKFKNFELGDKLYITVRSKAALKEVVELTREKAETFESDLKSWKNNSSERYMLGEAYIFLGRFLKKTKLEEQGFYFSCPGRYYCINHVKSFIRRRETEAAKNMAVFMKEQKGVKRDDKDIKLIMEASREDEDFGNCYFAFKELQRFFPDKTNIKAIKTGAYCQEKEEYYEEAIISYEKLKTTDKSPEIAAKIFELNFLLKQESYYLSKLKTLARKHNKNKDVLFSYLNVLKSKENISMSISVLDILFNLEKEPEEKLDIINSYLKNGGIASAVSALRNNLELPGFRQKLFDVYIYYLLFDKAKELDPENKIEMTSDIYPLRNIVIKTEEDDEKEVFRLASILEKDLETCIPPLLLIKSEFHRKNSDRLKTFSMLDAMLDCDKFYLPGMIYAVEMSYYQGDLISAENSLNYLLKNEKHLSPIKNIYHNHMILISAEIMIRKGKSKKIPIYLKKNMARDIPLGKKELEKLQDIYDKVPLKIQRKIKKFIKRYLKKVS